MKESRFFVLDLVEVLEGLVDFFRGSFKEGAECLFFVAGSSEPVVEQFELEVF